MGPATSIVVTICERIPSTIAAIAMTVATPITTPRMVSDERSALTRIASNAMSTFSPNAPTRRPTGQVSARMAVIGSSFAARDAG